MFEEIISVENLLSAWQEFVVGKRMKTDVQLFERNLLDQILQLHRELANGTYRHGPYYGFRICDPKPRHIHKACVRDRLLHHAVHRILYPFFEQRFIADSYSCRIERGVHAAGSRFRHFSRSVSRNNTRTCWVLKCDIRKFFASIHHETLRDILERSIADNRTRWLLGQIISSFYTDIGDGLPLGNLTSQLFANIYLNELDQFVKHDLRHEHYIRYADDFVFMSENRDTLLLTLMRVRDFLAQSLGLALHSNKVTLETFASGVDFLGWTYFPAHKVIRTVTKQRMYRTIRNHPIRQTIDSYLGFLGHGDAFGLRSEVQNMALLYGIGYNDGKT